MNPCSQSIDGNANVNGYPPVSIQDAKLFIDFYDICFPTLSQVSNDRRLLPQLKQEMGVQMLEDFGGQLLSLQTIDPTHTEHLRKTIQRWSYSSVE
ncbi:hypothetical protein BX616_010010 [Lobosporangium transversale]|nr:hypothetical protein BX616_010010 [Lobosporangium transversale]